MRGITAILGLTALAFGTMAFLHMPAQRETAAAPQVGAPAAEGEPMTASAIARLAERRYGGTVIEVELEEKRGRRYFEVKILPANGEPFEVELDVSSGALLRAKGIDMRRLPVDTALAD
ncbi:PepSY domain-containing protein [Roseococcus sp. YIM B11640]|uniref:PepSY domain-containing protein n=1 Tax=Roseococcus sp. YIM B11640 TaxID=3133973 RepID=UPI003C7E0B01